MSYDVTITETTLSGVKWEVFWRNYTSNVRKMMLVADIDLNRWNGVEAGGIVYPLAKGIVHMGDNPIECRKYTPANGWGNYEGCLEFLNALLEAAKDHPRGLVEVES